MAGEITEEKAGAQSAQPAEAPVAEGEGSPPPPPPPKTFVQAFIGAVIQLVFLVLFLLAAFYGVPLATQFQKQSIAFVQDSLVDYKITREDFARGYGEAPLVHFKSWVEWDRVVVHHKETMYGGIPNNDTTFWLVVFTNSSELSHAYWLPFWEALAQAFELCGEQRFGMVDCARRQKLCAKIHTQGSAEAMVKFDTRVHPTMTMWVNPPHRHANYLKQLGVNKHAMRFEDERAEEMRRRFGHLEFDSKGDAYRAYEPQRLVYTAAPVTEHETYDDMIRKMMRSKSFRERGQAFWERMPVPTEVAHLLSAKLRYKRDPRQFSTFRAQKRLAHPGGYLQDVKRAMMLVQKEGMFTWNTKTLVEDDPFDWDDSPKKPQQAELTMATEHHDNLQLLNAALATSPIFDLADVAKKLKSRLNVGSLTKKHYQRTVKQWRTQFGWFFKSLEDPKAPEDWCSGGNNTAVLGVTGPACQYLALSYHLLASQEYNATIPVYHLHHFLSGAAHNFGDRGFTALLHSFNEVDLQSWMDGAKRVNRKASDVADRLSTRRENLLLLWQAHNRLNEQLSTPQDEIHQWPSPEECPSCLRSVPSEQSKQFNPKDWNEDHLYDFLMETFCYGVTSLTCMHHRDPALYLDGPLDRPLAHLIHHLGELGMFTRFWRRHVLLLAAGLLLAYRWLLAVGTLVARPKAKKKKVD